MNKQTNTIMVALFVVLGVVLVTELAVLPSAFEQADAKCDGFKKNSDQCKPKKPKN